VTDLSAILHHLRDIALEMSKIAIFGYHSCVSQRDSSATISVAFLVWKSIRYDTIR